MSKEPGPREKALREMREAKFQEHARKQREFAAADLAKPISLLRALRTSMSSAAKKTGKSRKAKKK